MDNINFEVHLNDLISRAISFGMKLIVAIVILILGRLLIKWIIKRIQNGKAAKKGDPTVSRFLINVTRILLYVVLIITVIGIIGVPVASVVTIIASAGVAVGLALQGGLSNLAGGIMILVFRPFRLDDYITAGDFSGTVKDIGIFYTVLCTPDNKSITIPNGTIMGETIVNVSVHDTRRVDLVFSVAYGTDVALVRRILLEEADKHEMVHKDPAPFARLTTQNSSSLDFTLRVWTARADYWTVNFDLLENIHNRFLKENIEIPFNQMDVHIRNDS